jgi:hypothetical protein
MYQDVADNVISLSQLIRPLVLEMLQVVFGAQEEILGLPEVHPEPPERAAVELPLFGQARDYVSLEVPWLDLDFLDKRLIEQVESSVHPVSQEFLGFLHEPGNAAALLRALGWGHHHHSILLRVFDLCDHHGGLLAMRLMEVNHVLEGELTDYVRVEHEKVGALVYRHAVLVQHGGQQEVLGQLDRARRPQGLFFMAAEDLYLVLKILSVGYPK